MCPDVDDKQREWFEGEGVASLEKLGFAPGQRVLDFGCGPGRFTVPLSRIVCGHGGRVIAIDRSRDGLTQLQQKLHACGQASAVDTVLVENGGSIETMAVDPVDAVLAFDVLQHIENWGRFFEAACDVLKPNGALYIYPAAVPHPGAVDMDAARKALADHDFVEAASHCIRLPHANEMVEDTVYLFRRQSQP